MRTVLRDGLDGAFVVDHQEDQGWVWTPHADGRERPKRPAQLLSGESGTTLKTPVDRPQGPLMHPFLTALVLTALPAFGNFLGGLAAELTPE